MNDCTHQIAAKGFRLSLAILGGLLLVAALLLTVNSHSPVVYADPVAPPEGYPKLSLSVKTVTPTLAHTGGVTLYYVIDIHNTGACAAVNATLTDVIPQGTTYNDDAQASAGMPAFAGGTLTWGGDVGFDSTVVVSFSVSVSPTLTGTVRNTALISHPLIAHLVTATTETIVTDQPVLTIEKTAMPPKPGANKPLTYTVVVSNSGQPAINLPITVTDRLPSNTTSPDPGVDGITDGDIVTWTRHITLELGETTVFTFSVDVSDVPSGTVITNDDYQVTSPETGVTAGEPYTVTVVDPIFLLSKEVWPDPPGSNREMTYTLTLLNVGSLATNLVITDRVPTGVTYQRGGSYAGGVVSWPPLPSLDTGEFAEFTYTVYVGDVMGVPIVNAEYGVCCDEGICQAGDVLASVVGGPTFEASVVLDPIAKKPGGGGGPVTPTLVVRNLGPGNAIDATALLEFRRISVSANDLYAIPAIGTPPPFPSVDCGDKCVSYVWMGNLNYGETITFTTIEGQSTIGGEEGTKYTATVVITDILSNMNTTPVTGTATGKVTHYANLVLTKSALPAIGRGKLMTYTILVWNSALATDAPPSPWLLDVVPMSTTLVSASHGGVAQTLTDSTVISWTLPAMNPGDDLYRTFTVRTDGNLVSGTQIINDDYHVYWFELEDSAILSNTGQPVTTTIQEVGLIDSYKKVTPTMALPGPGNVLTYSLHIVNSSPLPLTGVTVYDFSPWQHSTYQRDAVASAGTVISDIVSVRWTGGVAGISSEVVTFTVLVDPDFQGPITNTAVISHPDLLNEVEVQAVAYITEEPVLRIAKSASPDPVKRGAELAYTIRIDNLGQQATSLVITDTVPANAEYVPDSATGGGEWVGGQVRWEIPVLEPGGSHTLGFRVTVGSGEEVVNEQYAVTCGEGVVAVGAPLTTGIAHDEKWIYLPMVMRNAQ
jgi:uncharacterized repeat protein (TIGR01451 family)